MKRLLFCTALAAASFLVPVQNASADHRHHRDVRVSVGFGGYGGYSSFYYGPVYRPAYVVCDTCGYSPCCCRPARYYAAPTYRVYSHPRPVIRHYGGWGW
jgi:hypothetical protein